MPYYNWISIYNDGMIVNNYLNQHLAQMFIADSDQKNIKPEHLDTNLTKHHSHNLIASTKTILDNLF